MSKDIFTVQLVITIALSIIDIGTIILIFDIVAVSNIFRKALERHASATFPLPVSIMKRMLMLFFGGMVALRHAESIILMSSGEGQTEY